MSVCILCGTETSGWAIVMTGESENPELGVECRRCSALPSEERKRLRDLAMARNIRRELSESDDDDPPRPRR